MNNIPVKTVLRLKKAVEVYACVCVCLCLPSSLSPGNGTAWAAERCSGWDAAGVIRESPEQPDLVLTSTKDALAIQKYTLVLCGSLFLSFC